MALLCTDGELEGRLLGVLLGAVEGCNDDKTVGASLGLGEGIALLRIDGLVVGIKEGDAVGKRLGSVEGSKDDTSLGDMLSLGEGSALLSSEGSSEALSDGTDVGIFDGDTLGCCVGIRLGLPDGMALLRIEGPMDRVWEGVAEGGRIASGEIGELGRSLGGKLAADDGPSLGWPLGLGEGIELRAIDGVMEDLSEGEELGEPVVGRNDGIGDGRVDG
ncbi:hypothetical protein MHU86_9200 [Fragilaria crotonensis]|nr:hypothetical protein MHU86_9200 [Fragilaria crotonensis]